MITNVKISVHRERFLSLVNNRHYGHLAVRDNSL
jgi:hypothetical protein